jgi:predicted metal-dependent phosphoesterase TrpH
VINKERRSVMAYVESLVVERIEWCRRQKKQARTPLEFAGWRAEEEGLRDAILQTDHTKQYRQSAPGVFERYAMGLQDGQVLIRATSVGAQFNTSHE